MGSTLRRVDVGGGCGGGEVLRKTRIGSAALGRLKDAAVGERCGGLFALAAAMGVAAARPRVTRDPTTLLDIAHQPCQMFQTKEEFSISNRFKN